jgi:NADPH:quinone reductase-like Zn-dependent oxidoreductase
VHEKPKAGATAPTQEHNVKAVRIYQYGGPEVLIYEDVPRPEPGAGEVLARVYAASVNPVDWKIRSAHPNYRMGHQLPLILGRDMSGRVEAVGPGATRLRPGAEVYARADIRRDGTYAQYVVIEESRVALKPTSIDHIHAAGIPVTGLTAWQALFETAQLAPGQRVLVHAAAGGLGVCAVQLAKWKGAYVIGTASAHHHDLLRDLGVDEALDYRTVRFEETVREVDVVLDAVGGDTQARSWQVLKKGGILVSVVNSPSAEQARSYGVRQACVFLHPQLQWLQELARLVDAGAFRSIVSAVLPLPEARHAHELSQSGHTRGKIVLEVIK